MRPGKDTDRVRSGGTVFRVNELVLLLTQGIRLSVQFVSLVVEFRPYPGWRGSVLECGIWKPLLAHGRLSSGRVHLLGHSSLPTDTQKAIGPSRQYRPRGHSTKRLQTQFVLWVTELG